MKKAISVLLAVCLLLTAALPALAAKTGDIDGDNAVTTKDARIALRAAIGLETLDETQTRLADVDGSGAVGTDDARLILRAAIGLENMNAAPWHTEHVWDEGSVTHAPGCETEGEKTFTCTVCGETRTEPIPSKGGHQWKYGEITKLPGCETEGVMYAVCAVCGQSVRKPIPSKGHQWNEGEVTLAPGCETAGEKTFTCTVCGETRTEAVPAAGHTWGLIEVISPATWLKNGTGKFRCSVCGSEKNMPIPAVGKDREDDRAERLLAFMKAHGSTEGGVTVYSFTVDDAVYKLSYDEAAPENGFLYTFDFAENVSYGEFGSNTYYSSLSLTLLPPFSAYEGSYRFAVDKLTYLDCTFSIADPAGFRMQNVILGMEITVSKNNSGLSESGVRDEVGAGLQSFLYTLEENLKENEADFSVLTDLGFAHLDEWKPL